MTDQYNVRITNALTGEVFHINNDEDIKRFRQWLDGEKQASQDFTDKAEQFKAWLDREVMMMNLFIVATLGIAAVTVGVPLIKYLRSRK